MEEQQDAVTAERYLGREVGGSSQVAAAPRSYRDRLDSFLYKKSWFFIALIAFVTAAIIAPVISALVFGSLIATQVLTFILILVEIFALGVSWALVLTDAWKDRKTKHFYPALLLLFICASLGFALAYPLLLPAITITTLNGLIGLHILSLAIVIGAVVGIVTAEYTVLNDGFLNKCISNSAPKDAHNDYHGPGAVDTDGASLAPSAPLAPEPMAATGPLAPRYEMHSLKSSFNQ